MYFSVVVRIYNSEKYLRKCIESVLNQSYSDFQLILIDDGSSDSSPKICDDYAEKDSRIIVCHQKNTGGVGAYLSGFKLVEGEYVCSLDADDWYEPNLLEVCRSHLNENKLDMLIFSLRSIQADSQQDIHLVSETKFLYGNDIIEFILSSTAHGLWMKAINKKCLSYTDFELNYLNENGRKFKFNNDVAIGIPLLNNIRSCIIINDVLYNYRILPMSSSHKCDLKSSYRISLLTYDFLYKSFSIRKNLTDSIEDLIIWESLRHLVPISKHFLIFFAKYIPEIKKDENFKKFCQNKKIQNQLQKFHLIDQLSFRFLRAVSI